MRPILRALRLFGRERGLWKYALRPMAWGILAYGLVTFLMATVFSVIAQRLSGIFGASATQAEVAGGVLGLVLAIVCAGPIYLGLVGLIAGFGFDRLSIEVEESLHGQAVGEPLNFASGLSDGVSRLVMAGVLGLVALCTAGTVIGPWLIASFLGLMDFTAPSLLRRGVRLGGQFGQARQLPEAMPFALISGLIVLVPVVNVLALPVLVAAGTILVADGKKG